MEENFKHYSQNMLNAELSLNSKLASISSILLISIYYIAITQNSEPAIINNSYFFLLTASFLLRIIHSQLKTILKNYWHNIFTTLLAMSATGWFLLLNDILSNNSGNVKIVILTYALVAGLSAASSYSFYISRRDFYIFQAGLMLTMISGFNQSHYDLTYRICSSLIVILHFSYLSIQRRFKEKAWLAQISQNFEMQKIIDTIPGGISVIKNGTYVRTNEYLNKIIFKDHKISSLVGYEIGNINGKENDFIWKIKKFSESNELTVQFETGIEINNEFRTHLVVAQNILKADGKETIVSTIDIHELKKTEQENKNNILKLEHSAKMASLGEMSSGLAHEINNPLAIISGRTQLLKKQISSEKFDVEYFTKGLDVIEKTTTRIAKIVKGLKTFARDADNDAFINSKLSDIVEDTMSFCEARFKNHGVDFKYDVTSADLLIECRPTQISQVLLNALNNSYDAIINLENKWIELTFETIAEKIIIKITDSGIGIPKSVQQKIMQPFFTTKEVGKGTGLGLSLSKGIIESHHGQFYFNFEHPNHTQLIIELPVYQPIKQVG